jgi:tetratricopeptide (TPR) repeat protein
MSAQLIKARSLIASINSHLKQNKLIPAVQALFDAVVIILKNKLMKAEKQEFAQLLDKAIYSLTSNKKLKEIYPLIINYSEGEERALLEQLKDLLKELQAASEAEVKDVLKQMQQRKSDGLAAIAELLEQGATEKAQKTADKLIRDFPHDADLKADIADLFLKAEQYKVAFDYLDAALKDDPEAVHLYNRIGIVLRKMQDFATAEQYYERALNYCSTDEYLYFNIGRLYHDWKKWDKMAEAAEKALEINPGFAQAAKMLQFAKKKMD